MKKILALLAIGIAGTPLIAVADTIDPTAFSATIGVGESVTVRKTVVVEETVSTGVLDVVFLIDTSGSMGTQIANAKAAAVDILNGLAGFGNLATGTGYYSEPGSDGVVGALTTVQATGIANINAITLGLGGNGFDFPEEGVFATYDAALNTAWRPGSSRFIVALGDATFKESDGATVANTLAALDSNDVTFIGINFSNMTNVGFGGISPQVFATATGGSIVSSGSGSAAIVSSILAGVGSSFLNYDEVSVSDLGEGAPGVGVSVACVSAGIGTCVGATAVGDYDRSTVRTFTFDVTFTGLATGLEAFDTHALVDGGIVASEADRITVVAGGPTPVPEPTTLALLGLGALAFGFSRRRRA